MTILETCDNHRGSEPAFYRWRIKYGSLKEDEAQRLKMLEQKRAPPEADRGQ